MRRIDNATAAGSAPAVPAPDTEGFFTNGNPGSGVPATIIPDWWLNMVQEELYAPVTAAGLTPSKTTWTQLRQALYRLFGGGLATLTADTTLTADHAGLVLVSASGGNVTLTLPAASGAGGRPIDIQVVRTDSSGNTVTIQRAGSDTIQGATSFTLAGQWSRGRLVSDGVSAWLALRGATLAEADAGTRADLVVTPAALGTATKNISSPGYVRLPGGLYVQWGSVSTSGVTSGTVTFPIAFPSACYIAVAQDEDNTTGAAGPIFVHGRTASQFGWVTASDRGAWTWLALGA